MWAIVLKGALVSGSLIMAIGAQNAFVLKQGLLRQHIFWVALICFACDFLLISLGVLGLGGLISRSVCLSAALALAGGTFLFWYGTKSFRAAMSKEHGALVVQTDSVSGSLKKTVAATLAMTLLNPHVYLDTVVLIGGIAAPLSAAQKPWFLLGAVVMSFVWFFGLGYGARLLKPIFANPKSWRILEGLIGIMMWYLALGLFVFVYRTVIA